LRGRIIRSLRKIAPSFKPFLLLWLTGLSLRVTLLAVPPLLLMIRDDFELSSTQLAALTTLPVLLFGAAATLGSGVVSSMGARRTLMVGLLVAAVASALRGAAPSALALFGLTFVMGLGIAAVQPAVPALVERWIPHAIGRGTATYVGGILVAEALAASLTLPVLLPALGGWEAALAVWALPMVVTAALVATMTRDSCGSNSAPSSWVPAWTEGSTWQLGAVQSAGSVAYFASNALFPVFLAAVQREELIGLSLSVLNSSQLLAAVLVGVLPLATAAGRTSLGANGSLMVMGALGMMAAPDLAVVWSALIGFCSAMVFTVSLALPAALATGPEVARLAAGMMTIGYGCAFLLPSLGGALLDATGAPWTGLSPVVAAGVGAVVAGSIGAHARALREGDPPRAGAADEAHRP
jgi:CP family cyanate transporter-like MFS transporter